MGKSIKILLYFSTFIFFLTENIYSEKFSWTTTFSEELQPKFYDHKLQKEYLPFFTNLFHTNNPSLIGSSKPRSSIPKIIHQIWLGSSLPEKYIAFQNTWKHHHPDWEYKLWTEEDLLTFNMKNQTAFDKAANYGEKANIWRYEILERFGGLYIDTDYECLKPFDKFMENYEFFTGMCSLDRKALVSNALIACIPNHPIIKNCVLNTNKLKWKNMRWGVPQFYKNGIFFFERTIYETVKNLDPKELTHIIVFPPSVFYPSLDKNLEKTKKISYAIHYFDSLWGK